MSNAARTTLSSGFVHDYSDQFPTDEGRGADRVHLGRVAYNNNSFGITHVHEWYCRVCASRVTVTPDYLEAGHASGCPNRPASCPGYNEINVDYARLCPVCGVGNGEHEDPCPHEGWTCPVCETDGFESEKSVRLHHSHAHGEPIKTRRCDYCHAEFSPGRESQQYCGPSCAAKAVGEQRRSGTYSTCEYCGGEFYQTASEGKQYCDNTCWANAIRKSPDEKEDTRECENCGDIFTVPSHRETSYCGHDCAMQARRQRDVRSCQQCGDEFECQPASDQQFCSQFCGAQAVAEGRRDGTTKACATCGDEFYQKPSEDRSYCGRECYYESMRSDNGGEDN